MVHGHFRYLAAALSAGVVAAALVAGAGQVAGAAPAHAGQFTRPATGARYPVNLAAVSCPTSSWCMAVGSVTDRSYVRHALAQVWDAGSWRVLAPPPGQSLTSVSCSSSSFCLVTDQPGGLRAWNGSAWRAVASPSFAVTAPSCASRSLCVVINGSATSQSVDFPESWNGRTWHTWTKAGVCFGPPGLCALNDVSCGSPSNCVAVGFTQFGASNSTTQTDSVFWNGTAWTVEHPPSPGDPAWLDQVSCAASSCLAAGVGYSASDGGYLPVALSWNKADGTWQDVSPDSGVVCTGFSGPCGSWASALSCGSATNCMTMGPGGDQQWNGASWAPAPTSPTGPGSLLDAVSCHGSMCLSVGYRRLGGTRHTLAELWNGSAWQIIATPTVVTAAAGAAQAATPASSVRPATARPASSSTLWSWGASNQGELGDGSYAASPVPVAVKLPSGVTVTSVAGGYQHALAVTSTGGVLAWGHNSKGELGDGNQTSTKVPVPAAIPVGVKITAVQGGCSASLALTSTGQLLAWGQNPFGELGDGTTIPSDVPVPVTLPPHVTITQISSGCETNLALTSTGRVLQWGRRLGNLIGGGGSVGHVPVFVRLPAKVTITSIAAGPSEAYAVSSTGQVYTWGAGRPSLVPTPPESQFGTITQVSVSYSDSLALTSRGVVLAWNGSSLLVPVRVLIPPNLKVTAIAIGAGSTAYALTSNGQLYAWGSDQDGALGDGGGPDINVPLRVEIPAGLTPTAIAAGDGDSPVPFAFAITTP